jgi:endonuclease/exonuclease/phosphatase family metal-dependent hydrolase
MRVLTINIWARRGPYSRREPLLRRAIGVLAPDLIAMQEVDVGKELPSQADELLAGLGYRVAYERREGENRGDPGIAIASRHPIGAHQVRDLGHNGVAIATRVTIGDNAFWFCAAVPLSWIPGFEGQREDECLVLDEWLTDLAKDDDLPPILAGDFDATPDAASIRFLTGLQSLHGRSTYWADAFAVAGDGSPGHTWSTRNPYVAPFAAAAFAQPDHHRRIDYVFVGSPFRWKPRTVIRAASVVLREEGGDAPSDHYGVMADLDLGAVAIGGGEGLPAWRDAHLALWPDASP